MTGLDSAAFEITPLTLKRARVGIVGGMRTIGCFLVFSDPWTSQHFQKRIVSSPDMLTSSDPSGLIAICRIRLEWALEMDPVMFSDEVVPSRNVIVEWVG